jgi:hypothetical protein
VGVSPPGIEDEELGPPQAALDEIVEDVRQAPVLSWGGFRRPVDFLGWRYMSSATAT